MAVSQPIPGVRVTGSIVPSDETDTYPSHQAQYGKGGHRSVADVAARDAIPADRREEGMTVHVVATNTEYKLRGGIADSNWSAGEPSVGGVVDILPGTCQGRLSLSSGESVPITDESGTTLYFHPHKGNRVGLFDPAATDAGWKAWSIPALGVSLDVDTSFVDPDTNYDVYLGLDSADNMELSLVPWVTDVDRETVGLGVQDGVHVDVDDAARLYVGTIRVDSLGGLVDTEQQRFVWNMYNRVHRVGHSSTSSDSWTQTGGLVDNWQAVHGGSAWGLHEFVVGLEEEALEAEFSLIIQARTGGGPGAIGFGLDSATANDETNGVSAGTFLINSASPHGIAVTAKWNGHPGLGYHSLQGLQWGAAQSPPATYRARSATGGGAILTSRQHGITTKMFT